MEKIKTIVDREPVSSDYIAARQEFGNVLKHVSKAKVPVWKSGWFYGPVGMAAVAVTLSVTTFDPASAGTETLSSSYEKAEASSQPLPEIPVVNEAQQDLPEAEPTPAPTLAVVVPIPEEYATREISVPATDLRSVKENQNYSSADEIPLPEVNNVPAPGPNNAPLKTPEASRKATLAHISEYYLGDIPVDKLNLPLECTEDIRIISFTVHYNTVSGTESTSVLGNTIPQKVIDNISRYNLGYMIFFTDIRAVNRDGKLLSLLPMNFTAIGAK